MDADALVGQILDRRYRVERPIGEGGMGVVVAARHVDLGHLVALKLMRADADPIWRRRFLREARAAAHIEDEHIARVLDVGRLDDGTPYLAMELLEGRDLADVLYDEGPLSVAEVVEFGLQACQALAAAHARGIVHRDVKPANLFLARGADGKRCLKLLDFGISKQRVDRVSACSLTGTHTVLGSPQFMSPEQLASSRDVDARADLWSLGATLFELLTDEHAFPGKSLAELCSSIMRDPPRRLSDYRPDAPPELEEAIERCLEKDRERRVPSARALAEMLAPLAAGAPSLRPSSRRQPSLALDPATLVMVSCEEPDAEVTPIASVRPVVASLPPRAQPKRARWPRVLAGAAALLFALGWAGAVPKATHAPAQANRLEIDAGAHVPSAAPVAAPEPPPPPRDDMSQFNDSIRLDAAHRHQIEAELAKAEEALAAGQVREARRAARAALTRLQALGVRPREGVSSLGARASLLEGRAEASALAGALAPLETRAAAEKRKPVLERGLERAKVAYERVRGWGVASLYRCAVTEVAGLDLAAGRMFAAAAAEATSLDDRRWLINAATKSLRDAFLGYRTALHVPAETTLCVDDAKRGSREAERALLTLPRLHT
jgi:serine/threonine-protein kinase